MPKTKNEKIDETMISCFSTNVNRRRRRHAQILMILMFSVFCIYIQRQIMELLNLKPTRDTTVFVGVGLNHDNNENSNSSSSSSSLCNPTLPTQHFDGDGKPIKIKRIVFGHMRKAGGTTIVDYLQKVVKTYNNRLGFKRHDKIKLVLYEGGYIESPSSQNNDTLYVSHIRQPIDRIITEYTYSGRWPCTMLVKHAKKLNKRSKQQANDNDWQPTYNNSIPIDEWIDETSQLCNLQNHSYHGQNLLWQCSSDCFVRWLLHPNGHCNKLSHHPDSTLYYQALDKANKFHIIIPLEGLRDMDYISKLEQYFGVPMTDSDENENEYGNGTVVIKKKAMYCDRESKEANIANPLPSISNLTFDRLNSINMADKKLYEELTNCGNGRGSGVGGMKIQSIQFPNGSLIDMLI